jgi:hypothetical protein
VTIEWLSTGVLQSAPEPTGPWGDIPNARSPFRTIATDAGRYFRLRR